MSDLMVLEAFKDFLKENVCPTINLLKPPEDDNVTTYELINPEVHVGWIPPNNFLPEGMESAVPCIIVGMDQESTDIQTSIDIRLTFVVYNPGEYKTEDGALKLTPNFEGYKDLLNLTERTKQELLRKRFIGKKAVVDKPINSGMYQDEPRPFWYGYMTFTARTGCTDYTESILEQYL